MFNVNILAKDYALVQMGGRHPSNQREGEVSIAMSLASASHECEETLLYHDSQPVDNRGLFTRFFSSITGFWQKDNSAPVLSEMKDPPPESFLSRHKNLLITAGCLIPITSLTYYLAQLLNPPVEDGTPILSPSSQHVLMEARDSNITPATQEKQSV